MQLALLLLLLSPQEEAESGMPGLPEALPPPGCSSKKGLPFLECVRRTQQE
jgi:hypothetical protein